MPTVVVVDDHPGFRAMVRLLLDGAGFEVVGETASGTGALAVVAALVPDVVLLDVGLPDLDGFSVCHALREAGSPARVVLCSVRAAADYGARVDACGAAAFLTKADLTVAALRTVLDPTA